MRGLKKPPYSSSKVWGISQWKIVTKGIRPAFSNRKTKSKVIINARHVGIVQG